MAIAFPKQAPVKNRGMMIPPRQPPVTVMQIARILATANPRIPEGMSR